VRVLITGAGLVGVHTAAALAGAGHEPLLLDLRPDSRYVEAIAGQALPVLTGDVLDGQFVREALLGHRAEAVVHTAGLIGRKCEQHPLLAFRVNGTAPVVLAEAARNAGIRRLVQISSLAVYDWPAVGTRPVDEGFPTAPRTPYAASKLAGELAVRCYHSAGWLDVAVLRLAGTYGPGRFRGGSVFGPMIQRVTAAAVRGERVTVPSRLSGHEYLHAADVAHAVRRVLEAELTGTYNVGTGRLHQAGDLADAVCKAVPGARISAHAALAPSAQVPVEVGSLRRALPGWTCRPLEVGIAEMVTTLRSHPWLAKEESP
jgi:UDP-glucose 4-epimerase